MSAERPHYDPATRTHYLAYPSGVYEQLTPPAAPMTTINIGAFADAVAEDEFVWLENEGGDGETLFKVVGIAAVLEAVPDGQ